ncbi:MAG TPA: sulfotransferase domain-containing protein [Caulobacteraceae bacterium]|nr:sulfotransferase domain-containing protein [Caulobacteraceae bacterium]
MSTEAGIATATAPVNGPTRPYRSMIMNSARWDGYRPRAGDVIVATYPKCGTTWTQRIVSLLIHQSPAPRDIMGEAPWIDTTLFGPVAAMLATLDAQTHRRSMKTHLPLDRFPVFPGVKVIHTVRDGRDACVSMHNHQLGMLVENALPSVMAEAPPELMAAGPPPPPPQDPREWFLRWIDDAEGYDPAAPFAQAPFCEFELTYWKHRHAPWLLHVHYADLKADLAGEMRRIAAFLDIATPPALMTQLVEAATFDAMKRDGDALLPRIGEHFDKGPDRFLHKGVNGRWKAFLTREDLERYDALIRRKLSPAHARWVEGGGRAAGDPRDLPD